MFACFAPHMGEEIWNVLGHNESIAYEPWPTYEEAKTVKSEIEIVVQVNGKPKAKLNVAPDTDEKTLETLALENDAVKNNIDGKTVRKVIVVKNRLVNIVAN